MTASDVPTTAGMPNNGSEGMRFLGFPVFEPLVDWDLTRADKPADIRPGLAEMLGAGCRRPAQVALHPAPGRQPSTTAPPSAPTA